jgi:hypothetical protein
MTLEFFLDRALKLIEEKSAKLEPPAIRVL